VAGRRMELQDRQDEAGRIVCGRGEAAQVSFP